MSGDVMVSVERKYDFPPRGDSVGHRCDQSIQHRHKSTFSDRLVVLAVLATLIYQEVFDVR
jgi:hypothetical protein